jgi:hypothetical protein
MSKGDTLDLGEPGLVVSWDEAIEPLLAVPLIGPSEENPRRKDRYTGGCRWSDGKAARLLRFGGVLIGGFTTNCSF